jgi:hypothetical protein
MKVQTRRIATLLYRDIYDTVPLFLCPALLHPVPIQTRLPSCQHLQNGRRTISTSSRRLVGSVSVSNTDISSGQAALNPPIKPLPLSCPGCGAPTQTVLPNEPGFYTPTRKGLQKHLKPAKEKEGKVLDATLTKIGKQKAALFGLEALTGMK